MVVAWLRGSHNFGASMMGRNSTKNPCFAVEVGNHLLQFLANTVEMGLIYGSCDGNHGTSQQLAIPRHSHLLEAFCDVSFMPGNECSLNGIIACSAGAPIQWEAGRQSFPTMSTPKSELVNYVEGMSVLQSLEALVMAVTGDMNESSYEKVILGDNLSAVQIAQKPDGPWRTRHLRLRAVCLKEKLSRLDSGWKIQHVKGADLVADLLTKVITIVSAWVEFWKFLGMSDGSAPLAPTEVSSVQPSPTEERSRLAKVEATRRVVQACAVLAGFWKLQSSMTSSAWCAIVTALLVVLIQWLRRFQCALHGGQSEASVQEPEVCRVRTFVNSDENVCRRDASAHGSHPSVSASAGGVAHGPLSSDGADRNDAVVDPPDLGSNSSSISQFVHGSAVHSLVSEGFGSLEAGKQSSEDQAYKALQLVVQVLTCAKLAGFESSEDLVQSVGSVEGEEPKKRTAKIQQGERSRARGQPKKEKNGETRENEPVLRGCEVKQVNHDMGLAKAGLAMARLTADGESRELEMSKLFDSSPTGSQENRPRLKAMASTPASSTRMGTFPHAAELLALDFFKTAPTGSVDTWRFLEFHGQGFWVKCHQAALSKSSPVALQIAKEWFGVLP